MSEPNTKPILTDTPNTTKELATENYTVHSADELRRKMDKRSYKFTGNVGTEVYAKRVFAEKSKPTFHQVLNKIRQQSNRQASRAFLPFSFDETRTLLKQIIVEKLYQSKVAEFDASGNTVQVIRALIKYFIGDPSCEYDLNKGLWIWGNVGRGKTFLMDCFRDLIVHAECDGLRFKKISIKDLVFNIRNSNNFDLVRPYFDGVYCFDDIGAEDSEIKIFGTDTPVVEHLLTKRYDKFKALAQLTHITSNVPPPLIIEKYGARVNSRCTEMFNYIKLEGKDKREKK